MPEISLDNLTIALTKAAQQTLPKVMLRDVVTQVSEPTAPVDPEISPPPPSVMVDFQLVPNSSYRFTYSSVRYIWLQIMIEREGVGRRVIDFKAIHNVESIAPNQTSEGSAPIEGDGSLGAVFNGTESIVVDDTTGAVGVEFSFINDPSTNGTGTPSFGLAYRITSATPSSYPYITATIVKAFAMEN